MDFTPAETTAIGVWLRTSRSADSSRDSANPGAPRPARRWRTPGCRPRRQARPLRKTVVAPLCPNARATGRSRRPNLRSAGVHGHPYQLVRLEADAGDPSSTAMVAGQAPCSRTMSSNSRATSRLRGRGRPWAMIVDSRATTGFPPLRRPRPRGSAEPGRAGGPSLTAGRPPGSGPRCGTLTPFRSLCAFRTGYAGRLTQPGPRVSTRPTTSLRNSSSRVRASRRASPRSSAAHGPVVASR